MIYIKRTAEDDIISSIKSPFITTVLGPRRVGKSTLITHFMKTHPDYKWVLLNMDLLPIRQRVAQNELQQIIEETVLYKIGTGQKIWVMIDEAQKCPALFEQIKYIYDNHKETNAIKFILTGSALLQLHLLSAESLAGRIYLHYLREFNLQEGMRLQNPGNTISDTSIFETLEDPDFDRMTVNLKEGVQNLLPFKKLLLASLEAQLIWGGFPEVLLLNDSKNRNLYLSNYVQTYLERDIRDIQHISDIRLYQHLMQILAQQTGSLRDDQKILSVLKCSRNTLKKYRDYLSATLLLKDIYPYIHSPLKRLVKSPKSYFLDNGLITYLTGIDDIKILQNTGLIGHRLENWFLKELQAWLDHDLHFNEVYFWRTSSGTEIDFVVQKTTAIIPFEVTYSSKIESKKINNLKKFMHETPQAKFAIYIYLGDLAFDNDSRVIFLPAWAIG